jgi:hypothetical protein
MVGKVEVSGGGKGGGLRVGEGLGVEGKGMVKGEKGIRLEVGKMRNG